MPPRRSKKAKGPRLPFSETIRGRLLRALCGLALVPLSIALAAAMLHLADGIPAGSRWLGLDAGALAFLGGLGIFAIAFLFFPRPTKAYIWAHELTHVLFAKLQGSRVRGVKVERGHGSVTITNPGISTLLAPYFFPFYTIALIVLAAPLVLFVPVILLRAPILFLIGATWGFHICFTITTLLQHQTDIDRSGYLFSYALIVFMNLLVLAIGLVLFSPITLTQFWNAFTAQLGAVFANIRNTLAFLHDRAWSASAR